MICQDERANNHQEKQNKKAIYNLTRSHFVRNDVKLLIATYLTSYCHKLTFNISMLKNSRREINSRVQFTSLIRQIKIIKTNYNNNQFFTIASTLLSNLLSLLLFSVAFINNY